MRQFVKTVAFTAVVVLACLSFAGPLSASDGQLSAQEVRETFIDREWTQGSGVFLFGSDGRWRYRDPKFRVEGVYELNEEGVICAVNVGGQAPGRRTCYSFFRNGAEYRYFHDRSGKYWPAILK